MTPIFEVAGKRLGPASGRAELALKLIGPPGIGRLDGVELAIRDDRPDRRASQIAGGPTAEDVAAVIWGPYRFTHGVDQATPDGRRTPPVPLAQGEKIVRSLDPTVPPPWVEDFAYWREQYAGQPVRLIVRCYKEGEEPWTVPLETFLPEP